MEVTPIKLNENSNSVHHPWYPSIVSTQATEEKQKAESDDDDRVIFHHNEDLEDGNDSTSMADISEMENSSSGLEVVNIHRQKMFDRRFSSR